MDHKSELTGLIPAHPFFLGIDSDGCVFDSMDVKHREFFIPNVIKFFGLFSVAGIVRETWEFVNLRSVTRGINRFPALVKVFDLLRERKEYALSGIDIPRLDDLRNWISRESKLSNSSLNEHHLKTGDDETSLVLNWSRAVNDDIDMWLRDLPPFRNARTAIEAAAGSADIVVVSQTPQAALEREWEEHGLRQYVSAIAGQEFGTKSEHIAYSSKGKYDINRIMIIGDAPGDLKAATDNGTLFYPVVPGNEEDSWKRLLEEALPLFLEGKFTSEYQELLISQFRKNLPAIAPWQQPS
ncbi:MAG TPA: hypothetical protein VMT63_02905 [Bacteroidales bacterium]|nr:hypothetical protein [Bacteroidales bacterium]